MRHPLQNPAATPERRAGSYGSAGLLASSVGRGWSGLSAELRSHDEGVIVTEGTQPNIEICVDVRGNGSVITRRRCGMADQTTSGRGMAWLSPAGLQEGFVDLSDPMPAILHLYLSPGQFASDNFSTDPNESGIATLRYEGGFQDPLVAEIAYTLVSELRAETSGGKLLAETLAAALAARLLQHRAHRASDVAFSRMAPEGLDRRRLSRVLDYIEAHLEGDLTIDRLASVACLSRFHFARAFKAATGRSPHRHVSARRLERAKALLAGDRSLADIALTLKFSCQANFTRAFRQVTGHTPGQYRRRFPGCNERQGHLQQ